MSDTPRLSHALLKVAPGLSREDTAEAMLMVANFICWHETHDMRGGVTAEQALEAFAKLVQFPPGLLKGIARGTVTLD